MAHELKDGKYAGAMAVRFSSDELRAGITVLNILCEQGVNVDGISEHVELLRTLRDKLQQCHDVGAGLIRSQN